MPDADIEYLVPWAEIESHERRLPHWHQSRVATLVTWRLADDLPHTRLAEWHLEREAWLTHHPRPWDDVTRQAYAGQFGQTIDRWLDAGLGTCVLREPTVREELIRVLQSCDGARYRLHAWVVMPNHVHVLFSPGAEESASRLIGAWKGVSARRIRQRYDRIPQGTRRLPAATTHLESVIPQSGGQECPPSFENPHPMGARAFLPARPNSGRLWQPESWDTLIRSPAHFAACRRYIADNPSRARLAPADYSLWLDKGAR